MRLPISSWKKTLSQLGFVAKRDRRAPQRKSRSLRMEPLEVRQLLTTVTIAAGANASEGGQSGYYSLSRDTTAGALTVYYTFDSAGSTANYMDFSSPNYSGGSVTFAAGSPSATLAVVAFDDTSPESSETVAVRLQSGSGYTIGSASSASVLILDNDSGTTPTVSVAFGQNASEAGQIGYFTFTRSSSSGSLSVLYTIDTTASTATYGSDYNQPATSGSVSFSPGQSSITLQVNPIDDAITESDETVVVRVATGTGYTVGSASIASLSITDNDSASAPVLNVSVSQNAAEPSQSGSFTFTRSSTSGSLMVYYTLDQTASTATYGSDFSSPSATGYVSFSPGQTAITLGLTPIDDALVEGTETAVLRLQTSTGYTIGASASATMSILDNDVVLPSVTIGATQNASEPDTSGYFTLTRSITSGSLTVYYTTDAPAGSAVATAGTDYSSPTTSGSVTFSPGASSVQLPLLPIDDSTYEGNESVTIRLQSSSGAGYTVGSASSATLLILDNETNAPAVVSALALANDTGSSPTDRITTDASLVGDVTNDGPVSGISVQLDYNGDGNYDATTTTDAAGHFAVAPIGLPLGPLTVRARVMEFDPVVQSYVFGDWTSLSFTLNGAVNTKPVVATLGLVTSTGTPGVNLATADPTLTGTVTNDGPVGYMRIDFDLDGNGTADETSYTDGAGLFTYKPRGLALGPATVAVRAVEWDYSNSTLLLGDWVSLSFTLNAAAGPAVANLHLVNDTGASATDNITACADVAGEATGLAQPAGATVEIDLNNDGVAEGTVLTDANGQFFYSPQNVQAGSVTVKARVRGGTDSGGNAIWSDWASFTFTLAPVSTVAVTNLHLESDTGSSTTDLITANPTILGLAARSGVQARLAVEFDHNGDDVVDGSTQTDLDGNFRYSPVGLADGSIPLRARVAEWDAANSRYNYGDWASFTFTLDTTSPTGLGVDLTSGSGQTAVTTGADAYRLAVTAGLNAIDTGLNVNTSLLTAGALDGLQIGILTPVAGGDAGFLPVQSTTTAPVNKTYNHTDVIDQTTTTPTGSYTVQSTTITTYSMQVTGNASSGSFVLDVTAGQTNLYEEFSDQLTPLGDDFYHIREPGAYALVLHASGTYSLTGGVIVYVGSYTLAESGSSDPVVAEYGSWAFFGMESDWTWDESAHSQFTRSESGSFAAAGLTADYTLDESGTTSSEWTDVGNYNGSSTSAFRTITDTFHYDDTENASSTFTYHEAGHIAPATQTTGSYSYDESTGNGYQYLRNWNYNNSYNDLIEVETSVYAATDDYHGLWGSLYHEVGDFNAAGETGDYTLHRSGSYHQLSHVNAILSFQHNKPSEGWNRSNAYSYAADSDGSGNWSYDESGHFSPASTSATSNSNNSGVLLQTFSADGTMAYNTSGTGYSSSYSFALADRRSSRLDYSYQVDATLTNGVYSGSYNFSNVSSGNWTFDQNDSYTGSVNDGKWLGGASSQSAYHGTGLWNWNWSDQGTYTATLITVPGINIQFFHYASTGAILDRNTSSYQYTASASGGYNYTYNYGGIVGGQSGSYNSLGWGNGQYVWSNSVSYSPLLRAGLYSRADTAYAAYSGSGGDLLGYTYTNTATGTVRTWGYNYNFATGGEYSFSYREGGIHNSLGAIGGFVLIAARSDYSNYEGTNYYTETVQNAALTRTGRDDWHRRVTNNWTGNTMVRGVFGPGGRAGIYSYQNTYALHSYGDGSGTYDQTVPTTSAGGSNSHDHYAYNGADHYTWSASDAGAFLGAVSTGYYSSHVAASGAGWLTVDGNSHSESTLADSSTVTNGTYNGRQDGSYDATVDYSAAYQGQTIMSAQQSSVGWADDRVVMQSTGNATFTTLASVSRNDTTTDMILTDHAQWNHLTRSSPTGGTSSANDSATKTRDGTYTNTYTCDGRSSNTVGSTMHYSQTTPTVWNISTGTSPPTAAPVAPTNPLPPAARFDILLDALFSQADIAYNTPATRAAATDAALAAFDNLDADENGQNGGATRQQMATPPANSGGSGGSGTSGSGPGGTTDPSDNVPRPGRGLVGIGGYVFYPKKMYNAPDGTIMFLLESKEGITVVLTQHEFNRLAWGRNLPPAVTPVAEETKVLPPLERDGLEELSQQTSRYGEMANLAAQIIAITPPLLKPVRPLGPAGGFIRSESGPLATGIKAKATIHGAERLLERGFTQAEIAAARAGRVMTQADGAKVFIHEVSPGKFNIIVEGDNGPITALKNISQAAFDRLAKNYGWR